MKIGAVFPQLDIGADRGAVRYFAQAVTELGVDHVMGYDHVVGANRFTHRGEPLRYWHDSTFHEPFVLFGFLAALLDLELVTGVIQLPQRQTVLVAKQAAEVDILNGGRLRLGVGLGAIDAEYVSLGQDFTNRGQRIEEQITMMRRLWTSETVEVETAYHHLPNVGMAPLPIQQPIPVWMGARTMSPALSRVGRIADGWISIAEPGPSLDDSLALVARGARAAGRDPDAIGLEGILFYGDGNGDRIANHVQGYVAAGAGYMAVDTMKAGLSGLDEHLDALRRTLAIIKSSTGAIAPA
jgi:probable F420-dependent oxidoreductase